MFSRFACQLGKQCRPVCQMYRTIMKNVTRTAHKKSCSEEKNVFWTEILPYIFRSIQKRHVEQKKASKNSDWEHISNIVRRVERILTTGNAAEIEQVRHDGKIFEVKLDVQHYSPQELSVTVSDGKLIIEGKHEMKEDANGCISRQFTREYDVPEDVIIETLQSSLSEDGVMTLQADVEGAEKAEKKTIEIKFERKKE